MPTREPIDPQRWQRLRSVVELALERPEHERFEVAKAECGDDARLLADALRMLASESTLTGYLESSPAEPLMSALARKDDLTGTRIGPYRLERVLGQGGMGTVYLAAREAGDFEQRVAIKVIKRGMDTDEVLRRFKNERQVLAHFQHPNVARLFDGGATDDGRPYLVMEHVEGLPIDEYCDAQRSSVSERLALFTKVCAAVHHAHQHLVIHRDLKPSNILVSRAGEPKLLDFGLAKVLEPRDGVETATATHSGLRAMTPAYASPEQVRGEEVTTASDVYSLGVVLYQLLTGQLPYAMSSRFLEELGRVICETEPRRPSTVVLETPEDPAHPSPAAIARARDDHPRRLQRKLRGDLDTIVMKALRKEPERRYHSVEQLAEDIERHLAGYPVIAQPDSWLYRASKFVQRNRALVAAMGVLVISLATGLIVSSKLHARAQEQTRLANERYDEVIRLADARRIAQLEEEADELWPAVAGRARAMHEWLERAGLVVARLDQHRARLAQLESLGSQSSAATEPGMPATWLFTSTEDQWQHEILSQLIHGLEKLSAPEPTIGTMAEMRARLAFAESVVERSFGAAEPAGRWRAAIDDIAQLPAYRGLVLKPQLGLVPLSRDPHSGLWEFTHLETGDEPELETDTAAPSRWRVGDRTGLVFVLLPGGEFEMGSPASEPGHHPEEGPVHTVALDPFFISKYETTQGQWLRIAGSNPSAFAAGGRTLMDSAATPAHPVESIAWIESKRWLGRLALAFPTEAQWEYAARGGTRTAWWTGDDRESLRGAANIADQAAKRTGQDWREIDDWPELDDGFAIHAPVGRLRANPFGLHDVAGNVWEWCDDVFGDYRDPVREGDGRQLKGYDLARPARGGGMSNMASDARSAYRENYPPDMHALQIGLRPVRKIER